MDYKNLKTHDMLHLKLIVLFRRDLKNFKAITIISFFLKLYGILLVSNSILINYRNEEVSNYIKILTLFGSELNENNFYLQNYNFFFFLIITLITACIISVIVYLIYTDDSILDPIQFSDKITEKKWERVLEKFISYTTFIFTILSQHLIEYLSIVIVIHGTIKIDPSNKDSLVLDLQKKIIHFKDSLKINSTLYMILAIIAILIINVVTFCYYYFRNEPLLFSNSALKYTKSKILPLTIVLFSNFQAILLFDIILFNNSHKNFHLIITCIVIFFSFVLLIKHYQELCYFNVLKISMIFSLIYSILACVVNLVFKYSLTDPEITLTKWNLLLKLSNELIVTIFLTDFLLKHKRSGYYNYIVKHLFKNNKKFSNENLIFLGEMLKNSIENILELKKLINIFNKHSIECKTDDCNCKKINLNQIYVNVNLVEKGKHDVSLKKSRRIQKFYKKFKQIISFIESVIINSISKITSDDLSNDSSILLHADFVSYFKMSYLHSNYLIAVYSNLLKLKLNFCDNVKFFLLKNNNYQKYYKEVLSDNVFIKFHRQYKLVENIKSLMLKNSLFLDEVIKTKKNYKISEPFKKSDRILEIAENIFKNEHLLKNELIKNPYCLKNSEICYLLYNYFYHLVKPEIPRQLNEILRFFNITKYNLDYLIGQKSSYSEMKMIHPLIVKFEGNENFIIKYACPEFCEKTNYRRDDIVGQEISILIPKFLERNHKIVLKKTIFIDKLYEIKKKSFVLTYDNYYLPTKIESTFSTNINGQIELILNLCIKNSRDNKYNKYFFLVDQEFNIISLSKNFEENYFFTKSIMTKLDITIINMLNLNYDKILEKFNKKISHISNNNIRNAGNMVSVMKAVEFTEMDSKIEKHANEKVLIKIHKSKFIPSLEKVKSSLEEFDSEKKYQIKKLTKIINNFRIIDNFKRSTSRVSCFIRDSSTNKGVSIQEHLNEADFFLLELELKQMGNLHFFYAKLFERKEEEYYNDITIPEKSVGNRIEKFTFDPVYHLKENILNNIKVKKQSDLNNNQLSIFKSNIELGNITLDNPDSKNSNFSIYSSSANLIANIDTSKKQSVLFNKNFLKHASTTINDSKPKVSLFKRFKEKYVFLTIIILLASHVGFFLYVFIYSHLIMTESENIFFVNFNSISLKSVVYYSSSAILSSCILADLNLNNKIVEGFTLNYIDIRFKLKVRSDELRDFYGQTLNYYSKLKTGAEDINNYIYGDDEYYLIYNDWRQYTRESNFDREIFYYKNYIYQLIDPPSLDTCKLTPFFEGKYFANTKVNKEEFTLYYIIKNVFIRLRTDLEKISNKSTEIILSYQKQIRNYFSITSSMLLLLSTMILMFMYLEIKILEVHIKSSIEKFLNYDIVKFSNIETKLEKYTKLIEDFNINNCKKFESTKYSTDAGKYGLNPQVKNNSIPITLKNNDIEYESIIHNLKLGKISKILLIIGFVVYLLISLIQLSLRETQFKNIIYANKISINTLERLSNLIELDLYYKFAVILNDPNFLMVTQEDYDSLSKLDIYEKFSEDSDEIYKQAKNTYFALIFYKIYQVNKNLEYFMENNSNKDLLKNTREHEELLADKDFCNKTSIYFFENYYKCQSQEECSTLIERSIKECDIYLNKDGFKLGYLSILSNLKNYFIDFIKNNKSQRNVNTFIYNKEILIATQNIEGIYKKIHSNYMFTIQKDMLEIYNELRFVESLFTFIQISFDICFLIFVFLRILMKMKKHSRTLEEFYEKIENNFITI